MCVRCTYVLKPFSTARIQVDTGVHLSGIFTCPISTSFDCVLEL